MTSEQRLREAVLKTVLYGDIFSYPLTPREVHHYLIECLASASAVSRTLDTLCAAGALTTHSGYVALAGRGELVSLRQQRAAASARLWPLATRWAARLARLPFVRMIAVTGALAVDNVDERVDIDYLIVTTPGRLWLARALVIGVVRAAERQQVRLCPNYLITTNHLHFTPHTLFAAHDLVQMVPLYGQNLYAEMVRRNDWQRRFLPQAGGPLRAPPPLRLAGWQVGLRRAAEWALSGRVGARLERWEFARKQRKFWHEAARKGAADILVFNADVCKGHFDGHATRTLRAYEERLRAHGLLAESTYAHRH